MDTTCDGCVVSRLGGAYFGVFFLGFFASRLRLSLFPIPNSMPRLTNLLLGNVQLLVSFRVADHPEVGQTSQYKRVFEDLCWCTSSGRPQSAHWPLIELWINSEPGGVVWSTFVC